MHAIQFTQCGRSLNFYKPGNPIHKGYMDQCDPNGSVTQLLSNRDLVKVENGDEREEFAIGMPFHGVHSGGVQIGGHAAPMCIHSFLAIGMSLADDQSNVFIVQTHSHLPTSRCSHHVDLDGGRRNTTWGALALLAGWRQGASSLGTVMAVSPGGSRIAAANWSQVLVWAFSPTLLHGFELEHYFPTRDYNSRKDIGRLRPFKLSSEGVVHSMRWENESKLYATTDQGLVEWDMGHMSAGQRHEFPAFDVYPGTIPASVPLRPAKWRQ